MQPLTKTLSKISHLIRYIETDYPELYQHLDENPVTLSQHAGAQMDTDSMQNYLETLKSILHNYKLEKGIIAAS
ncbi:MULTISPECIES: hypothetical protein [Aestuariibaculum]|uniref:Uncharacterized protein n=1 Tax=Aestuariibaculum lutulentum TaxID=2920935 RepID=A0ABS9RGT1_9FLAO|nr:MULTISPECIES: hypothetical protein [Aestuariibaculum]MCH4552149.1 hypothetical protein [Aestuariibaculum lutulentum]MCR8667242.1 hypothetical protein [Aestuariibaculum sp. M13]